MIIIRKNTSVLVQGCGYSERIFIGLGHSLLIPLEDYLRQLKLPEKKQILERGEKLRRKNHL